MSAPRKVGGRRKVAGKHKKKGWKKVDISKVEDFLEDERLQERTGGLVAEKSDESLFFVDTTGKESRQEVLLRREKLKDKPLKCFANLEPDPNTKAAHIPKKPRLTRPDPPLVKKRKKTAADIQVAQQRRLAWRERMKNRVSKWRRTIDYDLWEDVPEETDDEHYRIVTKKRRVNIPGHYHQKPSGLPAVQVPHAGASYNPTFEDHQELLRLAEEIELKRIKDEKKLLNALGPQFRSKLAGNEDSWLKEMSTGLNKDDGTEDAVPSDDDKDEMSYAPLPVRTGKKKTRAQRKRAQELKLEAAKRARLKEYKIKEVEFDRLKSIEEEINKLEAKQKERKGQKKALQDKNKDKTKKLGKLVYIEPELELKLGDELTGSLRLLKPEGHLLKDRFHSLQKRNVIETRVRAPKLRNAKEKKYLKKAFRNFSG